MNHLDYTVNPVLYLLDRINLANGTRLTLDDVSISLPSVNTEAGIDYNTVVTVSPTSNSKYYGDRPVYYNRVDIADICRPVDSLLDRHLLRTAARLSEIIPYINDAFGIYLRPEDYIDVELPPINISAPSDSRIVTIQMSPTSYYFIGTYDLDLTRSVPVIVEDDGYVRNYYLYIDGYDIIDVKSSMISLDTNGTVRSSFNYLANVTNIDTFDVSNIHRLYNGGFVLHGTFSLSYDHYDINNQLVNESLDASYLFIDDYGMLVKTSSDALFGNFNNKLYTNSNVIWHYAINDAGNIVRYDDNGVLDINYSPSLPHTPTMLRVGNDGKLYVVSSVYNRSSDNVPMIDISRLLQDGNLDTHFDPVTIASNDGSTGILGITDIVPIVDDGCYVAIYPRYGVDAASIGPIINDVSILPNIDTYNTTFSWTPIFKINDDGSLSTAFKSIKSHYRDTMIYQYTGSPMTEDQQCMVVTDSHVVYHTYRVNPTTGYTHRQPIRFTRYGDIEHLSALEYLEQYKWTNVDQIIGLSNGQSIATGYMQTLNTDGLYGIPYNALARYHQSSAVDRVLWRNTDATNLSIRQVWIDETLPQSTP